MRAAATFAFEELERQCIVRPSSSCWASLLHMVKMADGSWQPVQQFSSIKISSLCQISILSDPYGKCQTIKDGNINLFRA
jgi:hypothetical protein